MYDNIQQLFKLPVINQIKLSFCRCVFFFLMKEMMLRCNQLLIQKYIYKIYSPKEYYTNKHFFIIYINIHPHLFIYIKYNKYPITKLIPHLKCLPS